MKRFYKVLATSCAMALVVASPMATMDTHASAGLKGDFDSPSEVGNDGSANDFWNEHNYVDDSSSNSSEPAPAPAEDNSSYSEPSHNSSPSNSGSSSSDSSASYDSGSSGKASSSNAPVNNAPASTVTSKKGSKDATVCVTGGQKFRIVTSADYTAYQIYHCGISRASFKVADANGNAVAFNNVTLGQGDDNLWYLNVTFAEGVDTTGFTVTATAGDATYLSTGLGVSGIKVNGTVALSTVPATE